MLYRFRDKARYWSKIVIFSYNLHSTPPLDGFTSEFAIKFGMEKKLEWCGYPMVKQEAQLSQRDRATFRVIECFAKSLNITQGHSK